MELTLLLFYDIVDVADVCRSTLTIAMSYPGQQLSLQLLITENVDQPKIVVSFDKLVLVDRVGLFTIAIGKIIEEGIVKLN